MRIALIIAILLFPELSLGDWTPPLNPDPRKILNEAETDFEVKNYEDALSKHIWFHTYALKYRRSLYGVRLSFALRDWIRLSKEYPPALKALESVRDETEYAVRNDNDIFHLFNDFESINGYLGAHYRTVNLFVWLDKNQPQKANHVFRLAKPSLIREKKYSLCGKYIDPEKDFQLHVRGLKANKNYAEESKYREESERFAYKNFSNEILALVTILIQNGRLTEAEGVVQGALKEWEDPDFQKQLEDVLAGNIPEPWP